MRNQDVAKVLMDIAAALELKGENAFRMRAYEDAARHIADMREDVDAMARDKRLTEIPGVGPSIAEKIAGYLATGRSPYLEALLKEVPTGAFELLQVPGIGPSKANQLFRHLQITSIKELEKAAREHRIREVPGMGAKTEEAIAKELTRLQARSVRLPLSVAWPLADKVAAMLRGVAAVEQVEPAGSIRRRKETIGDIDLLVASKHAAEVERAIAHWGFTREILSAGPTKIQFLTLDNFQVDVRIVDPSTWGAALQHFTGSKAHNIALRERATRMGYKVNEYGVFKLDTDERVGGATEEEVYEILGLEWMPPEIREHTGELEAAENGTLPNLVTMDDILGDFHAHTTYSDGRASLEEMARAAIARGYQYLVITDHSYSLGVTQGLTEDKAEAQWAAIEALNQKLAPFRILRGVELEIRSNGELDFPSDFLGRFDVVSASVHTGQRQGSEQITERMLNALLEPNVHILNHPSGRLLSRRQPYEFDFETVLQVAKVRGKALEINGSFDRLDLNDVAARRARELGVRLSMGSDAHTPRNLDDMRFAVALARRAWCEPDDLLNCMSLDQLLKWLEKPKKKAKSR
ncbi:DNA polymerase/3'-5' exonuclease PolX [compost metagenome]